MPDGTATPPPPDTPPPPSRDDDASASRSIDAAQTLSSLVETGEVDPLKAFVYDTPASEMARAIARLEGDERAALGELLDPDTAAFVVEELTDDLAADLLEEIDAGRAAKIVEALPSDTRADVLGELSDRDAEAILDAMPIDEAREARDLGRYDEETAGGLMGTEFLAYHASTPIDEILADLRANAELYQKYNVQYLYVTDERERLTGVLRLRDIVMTPGRRDAGAIMIDAPLWVTVDADLDELEEFFDSHRLFAVPVLDRSQRLVGVVRREAVDEATEERTSRSFLRFAGILTGEERRDMPTWSRAGRRLAFLGPNILLNLVSVSVIAFFEPTIAKVTALAIFLPILSDMSGCSGNQAVAVSMRELALGLVKPGEVWLTLRKEVTVGLINGLLLGLLLGAIAYAMRGADFAPIGVVVGSALMANSVLAVCIGGTIPLILKRFGADPAMASGPVLTTITDLCGFFFALAMATAFLQ